MKVKGGSGINITADEPLIPGQHPMRHTHMNSNPAVLSNSAKYVVLVALVAAGIVGRLNNYKISPPTTNGIGRLRTSLHESNFVAKFEEALDPEYKGPFVPLIINNDGKMLCPKMEGGTSRRAQHFVRMLHVGLQTEHQRLWFTYGHVMNGHLPILLMGGDGNGCNLIKCEEGFDFPRLSWSMPSQQPNGSEWCHAIGIPSYELWKSFGKVNISNVIETHEHIYPWNRKIPKAVWRGSTTYDNEQYGNVSFHDIPRARLVQESKDRPDLIDAAFTKIHQRFENKAEELMPTTIMARRMPFDDQMKYKAIIDIDGNNWSARYAKLLCSNSVVIKIVPDFVEYFYDELHPHVHYIPASLANITDVASYVLDESNSSKMKAVVQAANEWCERKMTGHRIAVDAINQLDEYLHALADYGYKDNFHVKWKKLLGSEPFDDLVQC